MPRHINNNNGMENNMSKKTEQNNNTSARELDASLARDLAHPESMLRRSLTLHVARLRALADAMDEEGNCLKILGTTEKRIPHAFSRGAEMCGAADMARDWAESLEALLPKTA